MTLTSSGKQFVRSIAFDLDMIPWLRAEAQRQSASVSTIVRQAVRVQMDAAKRMAERKIS